MATHVDDILFKRYLAGDLQALKSLEAGLRFIAESILTKPCFNIGNPQTVRLLVHAVTEEALEHDARDLDSLVASVTSGAACKGIEYLRRDVDRLPGSNHTPPTVLVNLALAPNIVTGSSATTAEKHLESCELCRSQIALVRNATSQPPAAETIVERPVNVVEPPEAGLVSPVEEITQPVATEPLPSGAGAFDGHPGTNSDAAKGAPAPVADAAMSSPSHIRSVRVGSRTSGRSLPSPQFLRTQYQKLLVLPVVFVLAFWGAWFLKRELSSTSHFTANQLASLAARTPPPVLPKDEQPESARAAFQDLEAVHCSAAANRFRQARKREPENGILWYYEGLSFICAGDGAGANVALEGAGRHATTSSQNLDWYRAQAALLSGNAESALHYLKLAEKTCPNYKDSAWTQRERLEELVR
jgi:hypothetical protein